MNNMDTILLQVNDEKAYKLIEDLEALDIIKVLERSAKKSTEKLSLKFAGALKLTDKEYEDFQDDVTKSREQWNRDF